MIRQGMVPVVAVYRGARKATRVYRGNRLVWQEAEPETSMTHTYDPNSGTLAFAEISGDTGYEFAWDEGAAALTVETEVTE